jgi:hypothetical protein
VARPKEAAVSQECVPMASPVYPGSTKQTVKPPCREGRCKPRPVATEAPMLFHSACEATTATSCSIRLSSQAPTYGPQSCQEEAPSSSGLVKELLSSLLQLYARVHPPLLMPQERAAKVGGGPRSQLRRRPAHQYRKCAYCQAATRRLLSDGSNYVSRVPAESAGRYADGDCRSRR